MAWIVQVTCGLGGGVTATEVFEQAVLDVNAECPSYPGAPTIKFDIISEIVEGDTVTVGGAVDSSESVDFSDEFLGGSLKSKNIGELGWSTHGLHMFEHAGLPKHPGIVGGYAKKNKVGCMSLGPRKSYGILGSSFFNFSFNTLMFKVDDGALFKAGIFRKTYDENPDEGIYLEKSSTDPNYYAVCVTGGVPTRVDTLVPINQNWNTFRVRRINSLSVGLRLNSSTEITISTNIPQGALKPAIQVKGSSDDVQGFIIDRFDGSLFNLGR